MAASPIKPSDFDAVRPAGEDSICTLLVKFLRLTVLWYRWNKYAYDSEGGLSAEYKAQICQVQHDCA